MKINKALGDTVSNHKKKKNKNCSRIVYSDCNLPLQNGKHKYGEIITFENSQKENYAIAIGLNPAKGECDCFDSTNRKIAEKIEGMKHYKGYILLNLYSVIQPNCTELCQYIKDNPWDTKNNMQEEIIKQILVSNNDIFIFWGIKAKEKRLLTNSYLLKLLENLLKANNRNIYYSADNQGDFVHPANKTFSQFDVLKNISTIL